MRSEKRDARKREIEAVAYGLFAEAGFEGTSMLRIAREAKASNETLYRWYGDKYGLFESMVQANAAQLREMLGEALAQAPVALEALRQVAPVLLAMLLSDSAIILNRAAASDPSGVLGAKLAAAGRDDILPLIRKVLQEAVAQGDLAEPEGGDLGGLFMRLLVGDQQIRRAIGTLPVPSPEEIEVQAAQAISLLCLITAGRGP